MSPRPITAPTAPARAFARYRGAFARYRGAFVRYRGAFVSGFRYAG